MNTERRRMKQCPFCGGSPDIIPVSNGADHSGVTFRFEVTCDTCSISLPRLYEIRAKLDKGTILIEHDGRDEAANDWNRRYGEID